MQIIKALSSADTHLSKFTERYVVNSDKEFISGVVEECGVPESLAMPVHTWRGSYR